VVWEESSTIFSPEFCTAEEVRKTSGTVKVLLYQMWRAALGLSRAITTPVYST